MEKDMILPMVAQDNETGAIYVSWEVIERLYTLVRDQHEFYKKRSKALLESCKKRENGFLAWYEDTKSKIDAELERRSSNE